jgi:hypothetical protein
MTKEKDSPSGWWYAGAVIFLLVCALLVGQYVYSGIAGLAENLISMQVPGTQEILLARPGKYNVLYDGSLVVGQKVNAAFIGPAGLRCTLVSKVSGAYVTVSSASVTIAHGENGSDVKALFSFSVDTPGTYLFSSSYPPGREGLQTVLSVGQDFAGNSIGWILSGIVIMLAPLAISLWVILVTYRKRRNARDMLDDAPPGND